MVCPHSGIDKPGDSTVILYQPALDVLYFTQALIFHWDR